MSRKASILFTVMGDEIGDGISVFLSETEPPKVRSGSDNISIRSADVWVYMRMQSRDWVDDAKVLADQIRDAADEWDAHVARYG